MEEVTLESVGEGGLQIEVMFLLSLNFRKMLDLSTCSSVCRVPINPAIEREDYANLRPPENRESLPVGHNLLSEPWQSTSFSHSKRMHGLPKSPKVSFHPCISSKFGNLTSESGVDAEAGVSLRVVSLKIWTS